MKRIKKKSSKKTNKIVIISISLIVLCFSSSLFLLYGPYSGFRNWLITTAMTTMNHQYLATFFYSDETIKKVLDANKVIESDDKTDTFLINTNKINTKVYKNKYEKEILEHDDSEKYKMVEIKGNGYSGYLVAIYDPSNIKLFTSKNMGSSEEYLIEMSKRENALVAINGGGFVDDTTLSSGGIPDGILIKDGKIINSGRYSKGIGGVIGFTKDNKLFLGKVSASEAIKLGVRDAVEFGPFLIVNGEASKVVGNGGYGLHPRTVIGQRKDGVVLFLVIDGRRVDCIGADMDDLIEIMQRYGAYNAANIDGGNSSALIINNKLINHPINWSNQEATRPIADGFILVE